LEAAIIFLIFRIEANAFAPHAGIDPTFADAFQEAIESGVKVLPIVCSYENNMIAFEKIIPVERYPG
jgi:sugar fermentation stimulation protein A